MFNKSKIKLLSNSKVRRKGQTSRNYAFETPVVRLNESGESIKLVFSIASKGGGTTNINLLIGSEDFGSLVESMILANRGVAMSVISTSLAAEIQRQPEINRELRVDGIRSVELAALQSVLDATPSEKNSARLRHDVVKETVAKMREAETGE